jgi:hypothetical protein
MIGQIIVKHLQKKQCSNLNAAYFWATNRQLACGRGFANNLLLCQINTAKQQIITGSFTTFKIIDNLLSKATIKFNI